MSDGSMFGREPADAREAILLATFDALQKYGYAGISIQRIADESDLSKSTFYHHFDGKDDILLSFADFLRSNFQSAFTVQSTGNPERDLKTFLRVIVDEVECGQKESNAESGGMLETYIEVRSQAIRDERFREKFTEMGDQYVEQLAGLIQDGIDQGVFRDVDPEETAAFLLTMTDGATLEETTRTNNPMPFLLDQILAYVDDTIIADDA